MPTDLSNVDLALRLHELAQALAGAPNLYRMTEIITDHAREQFRADATCAYVRRPDGRLELFAQFGCTERFREEWRYIPADCLSLTRADATEEVFLGSAADFLTEAPGREDLVLQSGRKLIGYAPFRVRGRVLGLVGFSYNTYPEARPSLERVRAFASLCALALSRFYVDHPSSAPHLNVVSDPF